MSGQSVACFLTHHLWINSQWHCCEEENKPKQNYNTQRINALNLILILEKNVWTASIWILFSVFISFVDRYKVKRVFFLIFILLLWIRPLKYYRFSFNKIKIQQFHFMQFAAHKPWKRKNIFAVCLTWTIFIFNYNFHYFIAIRNGVIMLAHVTFSRGISNCKVHFDLKLNIWLKISFVTWLGVASTYCT